MNKKEETLKTINMIVIGLLIMVAIVGFAGCLNYGATANEPIYYLGGTLNAFLSGLGIFHIWNYLFDKKEKE